MPKPDPIRARRIDALRAEVSHRLEEINRLERLSDAPDILEALAKAPSIPMREEADFSTDLYE